MGNRLSGGAMLYNREHLWMQAQGDGTVAVGVTAYGVGEMGELCMVEFPVTGRWMKQGECFLTLESVKTCVELHLPFCGTCVESGVVGGYAEIEKNPEGTALAVFRPDFTETAERISGKKFNDAELMTAEEYKAWVDGGCEE